ncbi:MAG TPA: glycosyltransferase N-terminal domain-containing protein [Chthoniobacteraceae bacterium]|jgi:3-deoxy-D-manno-octulosonic-acid transferase|nr:glycosyltransferase N-terminal domain-containing protein [Chthoniobacteraceae bacterium]
MNIRSDAGSAGGASPRSLPADARRSLRLYRWAFPIVALFMLPGYLARLIKRGNYRAHFGQRLGWYAKDEIADLAKQRWTWIQSISVGETLVALKLAKKLRQVDPGTHIVLSVTTTTGFAMAQVEASEWLRPIYNPIDLRWIVRRVFRLIRPVRFIVIEGGIWPNLLAECHGAAIPLTLAGARLSPRSERRMRRFHRWVGPLFRLFDCIAVPELDDVPRWESLGVAGEKIRVTGSIKFDEAVAGNAGRAGEFRNLLNGLGVDAGTPILVAGSTFPGEETILAQCLLELRQSVPGLLLAVVPRHIERTPEILKELAAFPLKVVCRSRLDRAPKPDLLLIDTTGELRAWYALATVAFIGKSLTGVGGQNPAEPAVLGKPVVFGPHMENFALVTQHMLAGGAARQVANPAELTETLRRILTDATLHTAMSTAARAALTAHAGATERTAQLILHG